MLETAMNGDLFVQIILKYSQACIKRSPLGQIESGLIRQVTS